jgi:hypothetical protein
MVHEVNREFQKKIDASEIKTIRRDRSNRQDEA